MSDKRKQSGERFGWAAFVGAEVVECPSCGFTMGAEFTDEMSDDNPDAYSCPCCQSTEDGRALASFADSLMGAHAALRDVLGECIKYENGSPDLADATLQAIARIVYRALHPDGAVKNVNGAIEGVEPNE